MDKRMTVNELLKNLKTIKDDLGGDNELFFNAGGTISVICKRDDEYIGYTIDIDRNLVKKIE